MVLPPLLSLFNLERTQHNTWTPSAMFFHLSEVQSYRSCLTSVGEQTAICGQPVENLAKVGSEIAKARKPADPLLELPQCRAQQTAGIKTCCQGQCSKGTIIPNWVQSKVDVGLERDSLSSSIQPKMWYLRLSSQYSLTTLCFLWSCHHESWTHLALICLARLRCPYTCYRLSTLGSVNILYEA